MGTVYPEDGNSKLFDWQSYVRYSTKGKGGGRTKLVPADVEAQLIKRQTLRWSPNILSCILSLEKIIFAVMGEKLTKRLRMSLLEEIMHK